MVRALGPDRRMMPIPPRPGGVEMATMVSSESNTFLKCNLANFFWAWWRSVFTGGFGEKSDFLDGFLW